MLRQMRSGRRFAGATLEVYNTDDLQFIIATTMGNITFHFGTTVLIKPMTEFLKLFNCISTAPTGKDDRLDAFAFQMKLLEIARETPRK